MEIVAQSSRRPSRTGALLGLLLLLCPAFSAADSQEQTAEISCRATRNGVPARASLSLQREGGEVVQARCGSLIPVAPARYTAVVRLHGNLDQPRETLELEVSRGQRVPIDVNFPTGLLEVRVTARQAESPVTLFVLRGEERIGTLGNGVTVYLTEGSYDVVAQHAGREQRHRIRLKAGHKRMLRVQF